MQSLYKKILKGNYTKIPEVYSFNLNAMIHRLL